MLGALSIQKAALESAKLNLSYTNVKAPVDGKIGKIIITEGNLVNPTSGALAKLVSTTPIYAYFTINSEDYMDFKKAAKAGDKEGLSSMVVNITLADGTQYPENGKVEFVDNVVDTNLGTISLRATFTNKDNILVPGDFINVTAKSTEAKQMLLVPIEAVQESTNGMYVVVVKENNDIEQRFIKANGQYEGHWIVTDGLNEKEQVVVKGLQKVQIGRKVEIVQPQPEEKAEENKETK